MFCHIQLYHGVYESNTPNSLLHYMIDVTVVKELVGQLSYMPAKSKTGSTSTGRSFCLLGLSFWGFPTVTPVPVMIVTKSHGFPKADSAVPDPVSDDDLKMVLAIVHKLPAIAMPLPFGVDVYRVNSDGRSVCFATGFADAVIPARNICPIVF